MKPDAQVLVLTGDRLVRLSAEWCREKGGKDGR